MDMEIERDIVKSISRVKRWADNGEFSHYELIRTKTGEVLWYSGTPDKSGRYLIVYKVGDIIKPFVADWNDMEEKWEDLFHQAEILWWKEIPNYLV